MGFADYLGEPGCLYSCDEYKDFEDGLRAVEDQAFENVQTAHENERKMSQARGPISAASGYRSVEKAQQAAQEVLLGARMDREELEPAVRACDKSACAVVAFCNSKVDSNS